MARFERPSSQLGNLHTTLAAPGCWPLLPSRTKKSHMPVCGLRSSSFCVAMKQETGMPSCTVTGSKVVANFTDCPIL